MNGDGQEWEFPSQKELGAVFRAKREELGLDYDRISKQTKIKPNYLEALENEEWDRLPSPPFVRGFIRSYARALGLPDEGLLALYQETLPPASPMPRPIQAESAKKRTPLYLVLILLGGIACLVAAYYYWISPLDMMEKPAEKEGVFFGDEGPEKAADDRAEQREAAAAWPDKTDELSGPAAAEAELSQDAPGPAEEETVPATLAEASAQPEAEEAPLPEAEKAPLAEAERQTGPETVVSETSESPEAGSPALILKAAVRQRTYVKISIDGEKPKEYIFEPESSPEWRAQKGFELLIGNAGGITLEFNGQKMDDLGKEGQVVRLRLPAD